MLDRSSAWSQAVAGLQQFWGYNQFRPLQGEAVTSLLMHQDTLVMLPTGSGKSICFQLPALLQPGLTVVISPLIALMENQVHALQEKGLPAEAIHSQLSSQQRRQTLKKIEHRQLRLLYLSPESLLSKPVWERLCDPHLQLQNLIVDEAHCITQWGSSFRPVYRRLGSVRPALTHPKAAPSSALTIAAYTATANSSVQKDIIQVLKLRKPGILSVSPYRPNLDLKVDIAWSPACRRQQLLRFIRPQRALSGLIFTSSRRLSESLATWLIRHHLRTEAYHAGLSAWQRRQIEAQWLKGDLPFVVCTSAFGMGIDKPDVRWVAHYHPPLSLSAYLQEIGRAGRDNLRSQTLLLASEPTGWLDPQDRQIRHYHCQHLKQQHRSAQRLMPKLPRKGHIDEVTQNHPGADLALALLHEGGCLEWEDPFHFRIKASHPFNTSALKPQLDMVDYLYTRQCRWQFILQRFGFPPKAQPFHCGHCDRCRSAKGHFLYSRT
ncbi:ATP-dependent DNA helicase RecQ [Acaryochloris sp. IP29b_bin.137]|uniref:RecQ family ATP-dependent DNA helicase n=1 Tax=Acaryochloris sp. IP29b_bin.137 TaxID=2969217 RepID=UPI00260E3605|nr:ATP-dependent DNA helicase RecQ [Acaryochloris sp. IP29b_bin.137]